jgi:hypothetical protein
VTQGKFHRGEGKWAILTGDFLARRTLGGRLGKPVDIGVNLCTFRTAGAVMGTCLDPAEGRQRTFQVLPLLFEKVILGQL